MLCVNCGAKLTTGVKVCPDCGTKVGAPAPATAAESPVLPHMIWPAEPERAGHGVWSLPAELQPVGAANYVPLAGLNPGSAAAQAA